MYQPPRFLLPQLPLLHRLLRAHGAASERRRQARHPAKKKPELLATGPGQVWSWDITKLRGPDRGSWFQLYVVLDIFSRYVVAFTVQTVEDSEIAKTMLEEAMRKAAKELDFEKAAALRDRIEDLKVQWGIGVPGPGTERNS